MRRRGFAGTAPRALLQAAAQVEGSVPLAAGPRSATWRLGDTVWKHYPREGAWQSLRRQLGAGPGRAAYRHLAVLELLGLPASRPLAPRRQYCAYIAGYPPKGRAPGGRRLGSR